MKKQTQRSAVELNNYNKTHQRTRTLTRTWMGIYTHTYTQNAFSFGSGETAALVTLIFDRVHICGQECC